MADTLLQVNYPLSIAHKLGPTWSVVTTSLGSAGKGWGVGSIGKDAEDMAKIVAYFKQQRPQGKIIIMGHSTGCQDCMEYLVGKNADKRPAVDGVILQAPVSDREALHNDLPEAHMNDANQLALKMCREGKDKDALPNRLTTHLFGRTAISARRWVDIASPAPNHDGADDYFSSDLPEERLQRTFGKLPARSPLLILYSGADESVPQSVDKRRLVQKWMHITESGGGKIDGVNGGVVESASHNLNGQPEAIVQDLVRRVSGFIARIESGELTAGGSRI
jgi:alpha-beta hydrolase superfamily lysophospholipase